MKRFFSDIKKFRNYIMYSARSELKAEVAGSFLSWLWWFLDPLLFMGVYAFIAILIFNRPEPHFPVFVFIGLNCWQFFNKSVKASVRLIKSNKNIVTKVYIPKHMFILSKMGVYGFKMFVSFGLTIAFLICDAVFVKNQQYPINITFEILWLIPLFLFLFIGTFAICLFIMHFGVFIEDLSNVITVVLQLGFYVSGIFFSLESRLANAGYELLGKVLVTCNPIALIVTDMRVAFGIAEGSIHFLAYGIWMLIALVVSVIGIRLVYRFENSYVKII